MSSEKNMSFGNLLRDRTQQAIKNKKNEEYTYLDLFAAHFNELLHERITLDYLLEIADSGERKFSINFLNYNIDNSGKITHIRFGRDHVVIKFPICVRENDSMINFNINKHIYSSGCISVGPLKLIENENEKKKKKKNEKKQMDKKIIENNVISTVQYERNIEISLNFVKKIITSKFKGHDLCIIDDSDYVMVVKW